ncbi:hypothetical protein [Pseudonocardia acaciae]|uniref:hypothetical protein n=1 Tax=Pseudonocardia acaciae TaxID=551276 RepID=UPI0006883851|nr:hypothetical protein [Pseudonocardia acaciae]
MREIGRELWGSWRGGRRIERLCYLVGAVLVLSGVAHLGVQAVVGGPWEGPVSWRKPVTFGLSFGLTLVSVTWVASFVRMGVRARALLLGAFGVASVAEVGLITAQAWRRVPSHFNFETTFDTRVTTVLAAGGGVLITVVVSLFVLSLRAQPGLEPLLRAAIRAGFGALVAAMAVGAVMIGIGTTLARGGDPQAAYHTAGAFKLAHAVAMHGIALLPGLAWLGRFGSLAGERRARLLALAAVGYVGLLGCALAVGPTVVWVLGAAFAAILITAATPIVLDASGLVRGREWLASS